MDKFIYNWDRLWLPFGSTYKLDSLGFPSFTHYNFDSGKTLSDAVTLKALKAKPCVVLLGEPGSGKTTEVERVDNNNELVFKFELNKRSSETELIRGIEEHEIFRNWLNGDEQNLYLYLDGLDEAQLNIKTIRNAIIDWLQINSNRFRLGSKAGSRRLFLRITCRSGIWSNKMTAALNQIFEPSNVGVYELAPLTQDQVKEAAVVHSINTDEFIQIIVKNDLIAFTAEPVSLKFLLASYLSKKLQDENFNKASIFYEGAIHLATEMNEMYKMHLELTAESRVRIASRLATYIILCNKPTIWNDASQVGSDSQDLLLDEIVGDNFTMDGTDISIQMRNAQECISSGLFTLDNVETRVLFKHKTYSEFLSAYHLNGQKAGDILIEQLLSSPFDRMYAIPQTQEVLKWLATMNSSVFRKFLKTEPLLLLKAHRQFSLDERKMLVEAILNQASAFQIKDSHDTRKYYNKLSHPLLAKQLKKALQSRQNTLVTRAAIDIAGACMVKDAVEVLLELALDLKVNAYLRKEAINSLGEINDHSSLMRLQNLLSEKHDEDADDEVIGSVLKVLYPQIVTIGWVIDNLRVIRNKNLYGAYRGFLDSLGTSISSEELTAAIDHLLGSRIIFKDSYGSDFEKLLGAILNRAWDGVEKTVAPNLIAKFLAKFYKHHISFEVTRHVEIRRAVTMELIKNHRGSVKPYDIVGRISHKGGQLLNSSDWDWLLSIVKESTDEGVVEFISQSMKYLFDHNDSRNVVEFLEVAFQKSVMLKVYATWLNPVELGSKSALESRREFEMSRQSQIARPTNGEEQVSEPQFSNLENVVKHLRKVELGNLDDWWKLILALGVENDNYYNHSDFEFDVTRLAGWNELDIETTSGIKEAAKKYLQEYTDPDSQWIFTNEYNRRELGGYKALFLLFKMNDPFVKNLDQEFWDQWQEIIFYCVINYFGEENEVHSNILSYSFERSRELYGPLIRKYFLNKRDQGKDLFELYRLRNIVDNSVGGALLDLISASANRNNEIILDTIFEKGLSIGYDFAWKKLRELYRKRVKDVDVLVQVVSYLVRYPRESDWELFWKKVASKNELAKKIVLKGSGDYGFGEVGNVKKLSTNQLANLIIWLFRNFPPNTDPIHQVAYSPTYRDNVADLRGNIVRYLIEMGTVESLNSLRKVAECFKDNQDFKWWLVGARENLRRNMWEPPKPVHLRTLLNDVNSRVVRSEDDLLSVVKESLERLQKKLQGDNPAAFFLWNKHGKSFKPKDENSLSDLIKLHFEYDLREREVIINREVEIKRSTGRRDGQRTDLYIQAYSKQQSDKVTLVVETKGCWHKDVTSAIRTQLKDRYLARYKSTHGLYVVGWFFCDHFKPRLRTGKTLLTKELKEQAMTLSNQNVSIDCVVLDCTI